MTISLVSTVGRSRFFAVRILHYVQTIYTFTGATSAFLTGFTGWFPDARVVILADNYRSSPEVLELANRLLASSGRSKRLAATRPTGPEPSIARHGTESAELAALTAWVRARLGEGIAPSEIAVLVRMNAQLAPIEAALTRAGIAYQVRGIRFFDRADVRGAIDLVRTGKLAGTGTGLAAAVRSLWGKRLGYDDDAVAGHAGEEARERTAALDTLLDILATLSRSDAAVDVAGFLAELDRRRAAERAGSADGVNLLTYHRAKGLEWDAVALPGPRGRDPADPPGRRRRRAPGRGAPPPVRRHHSRTAPSRDLVGG